jgi:hypothetical protein
MLSVKNLYFFNLRSVNHLQTGKRAEYPNMK